MLYCNSDGSFTVLSLVPHCIITLARRVCISRYTCVSATIWASCFLHLKNVLYHEVGLGTIIILNEAATKKGFKMLYFMAALGVRVTMLRD
jgi:hypothetical protein